MAGTRTDLDWAKPVMRAGYAGRAIVYLVVAGFSLYAIWRGGEAEGTSSALENLEASPWGKAILVLIFLGMLAYAIWRIVDSIWDLEEYGSDGEGTVARLGMVTTGIIHAAIGVLAFTLVFTGSSGGGGGSSIGKGVSWVMQLPGGRWIVAAAGLVTIGAGIYYVHKGWTEKYREHLRANHFTTNWNPVLKAGLMSQGVIVAIVGGLFTYAAYIFDPNTAGGVGKAFSWLSDQPYGRILVALICVGLLGFALFCAVNAAFRIIPKLSDDGMETLAKRLSDKADEASAKAPS